MLRSHPHFERNPYFHFHPMHSMFSLIAALALLGAVIWMVLVSGQ